MHYSFSSVLDYYSMVTNLADFQSLHEVVIISEMWQHNHLAQIHNAKNNQNILKCELCKKHSF